MIRYVRASLVACAVLLLPVVVSGQPATISGAPPPDVTRAQLGAGSHVCNAGNRGAWRDVTDADPAGTNCATDAGSGAACWCDGATWVPGGSGGGSGTITAVGPGCASGACLVDGITHGKDLFIWEGNALDTFEVKFDMASANPDADRTITFPTTQTGTVVLSTGGALGPGDYSFVYSADLLMGDGSQVSASNLGIEFTESNTHPTCTTNNYNIYADLDETSLKACSNDKSGAIVLSDPAAAPAVNEVLQMQATGLVTGTALPTVPTNPVLATQLETTGTPVGNTNCTNAGREIVKNSAGLLWYCQTAGAPGTWAPMNEFLVHKYIPDQNYMLPNLTGKCLPFHSYDGNTATVFANCSASVEDPRLRLHRKWMLTAVVIKDFDAADNDTGTACKVEVCKHNTNAQDACTIGTVLNYVSGSPGDSTNFAGTSVGPATYTPWDTGATAANWVIASTEYVSIKFGSTCDNGTAFQPIVSMWGVVVP